MQYFSEPVVEKLTPAQGIWSFPQQPLDIQTLMVSKSLINILPEVSENKLLLHSLALSVLSVELTPLMENCTSNSRQKKNDEKIAREALKILHSEFRSPPSVKELALRCGTNQLKLKQIFHVFHNSTPYAVLHEIRMKNAYQLLQAKTAHVSVIADRVGYKHASNFSTAYRRYFGFPPKQTGLHKLK